MITLRIVGLGHTLTLEEVDETTTTVGALKETIQSRTGFPSSYQKLLARGSKLDDNQVTLDEVGIKDRTKLMLMTTALYAQDKNGYEALQACSNELDEIQLSTMSSALCSELITRLCCKIDAIEMGGSETLRKMRKELLKRADNVDPSTGADGTTTTANSPTTTTTTTNPEEENQTM